MCDSITNGGYIPTVISVPPCPPSNVIIASNVLSTTGNVLCANIISGDGTFSGNLLVTGTINGLLTFAVLNVSQTVNTNSLVSKSYLGNGYGLSTLNASNLLGLISNTNLPLTGVTAGQYGSSANVSQVTIDQYGRVTTAANVAILSSQWTTVAGNVAYGAGVSIGTLAAPPVGSNLYVLGTANMTTLNVTTLFANSATIFGSKTLNVFGISNLNYIIGDGGGISNVNSSSLVGTIPSSLISGNTLSNLNASNLAFGNIQGYVVYGNTLSNIQASNIVGLVTVSGNTLSNLNASNLAFGNIQGYVVYGNTLSNIQASSIVQPFANLVVSNTVAIGNTLTVAGAMTSNAANTTFFYDTFTIPYINTQVLNVGAITSLTTLNVQSLFANSMTVYGSNTLNVFGISNLNSVVARSITGNGSSISSLNSSNLFGVVPSPLILGNTLSNIQASNIVQPFTNLVVSNTLTTTNIVAAGFTSNASNTVFNFDTLTIPFINSTTLNVSSTSNLQVATLMGSSGQTTIYASGNVYVSNALTTTNVLATSATLTGNMSVANALTTTNVFVATVSSTNPIPFRNRIINGGMTLWQRNTASISTTASLYTTADRWCGALGTSGLLLSQWPGPTEALQFPYSLQVTTSTTTTGVPLVEQRIEYLNIPDLLNGTPVTVSFYAGQPYGTLMPLTVGLYYATAVNNFGTQTLAVAATQNTPTLTTANLYYTLSFTLNTSLGAANGLALRFTTGGASAIGSTVLLTGVQVEKGLLATPFEVRPYGTELALAQRYYYQLTSPTVAAQGSSAVYAIFGTATGITTTAFWLPIQFPVPMRAPNYTVTNSAVSSFQLLPTGTTTITGVGVQSDSYTSVGATLNFVGTNIVPTASYIFRTNNLTGSNVAFFGFSAEL
jgi:hypothetical protein